MSHISTHPDYAQIAQEINSLGEAQGKVMVRLAEVESLLRVNTPDDGSSHVEAALQFAETGKVVASGNGHAELRDSHLILRQQRDALANAIKDKQEILYATVSTLSRNVCTEIAPAHRKIAARYLQTLKQLDAIAEEERALMLTLEKDGYSVSLREYVNWPYIGTLRDVGSSVICQKVKELSAYVGR